MTNTRTPSGRAPTGRGSLHDWGNALTLLLVSYAIGYLAFMTLGPQGGISRVLSRLAFLPMNLGAATLAWRAAASPDTDRRIRAALRALGAAFASVLVGNAMSFYLGIFRHGNPLGAWTNIFFFAFYPLALAGLLALPIARRERNEGRKFFLDATTVLVGGGVAIWYLVVRPTATFDLSSTSETVIALAYPLCSLLLLVGIVTVMLRRPAERQYAAPRLLIAALMIYLLADLANDVLVLRIGYMGIAWTDFPYMLSYVLLLSSFRLYYSQPPVVPANEDLPRVHGFSPLPYASITVCSWLLLSLARAEWPSPLSVLAVGVMTLTALIVLRQVGAVRENTRLVAEQTVREKEARFKSLVQHSSDVIAIVDVDSTIRYVSPSVSQVFDYTPEELEARKLLELIHPDDAPRAMALFSDSAAGVISAPVEVRARLRNGEYCHVETIATNLLEEPSVRGIVLNTRDISERKQLQAELTHQAFHDALTGLANRALFLDRVAHALNLSRRRQGVLAVIFVDLDNFKTVNDSLGHAQGDALLTAAARRLLTAVRSADTVARLGGDEFAMLIEDASDDAVAGTVVQRIMDSLAHPFNLEGKELYVSASVGIATARDVDTASDLLRNADMAMYIAKSRGKARVEVYEPHMHEDAVARLELEADLRRAIEREEFSMRYQPIVRLRTGEIMGIEALVRWEHPTRGTMTPMQFIPLAEETGLIVPLGKWVVHEACRQGAAWIAARGTEAPLSLTINISGHQLKSEQVVHDVRVALEESGFDPHNLVLEITESVLMQQSDAILDRLRALKALGVRLAIDDFGTGYSSLGYLQRFPIDILKIDKTFVDDVGRGGSESALAKAVIALGETLQLQTIAEGIEMKQQLCGLQDLGCEMGQGYFFARPIRPDEIQNMLLHQTASLGTPPYEVHVKRELSVG